MRADWCSSHAERSVKRELALRSDHAMLDCISGEIRGSSQMELPTERCLVKFYCFYRNIQNSCYLFSSFPFGDQLQKGSSQKVT